MFDPKLRFVVAGSALVAACAATSADLARHETSLSDAWIAQHLPLGSTIEASVLDIANDVNLSAHDLRVEVRVSANAANAMVAFREGDDPSNSDDDGVFDTIAELDALPYTNVEFFEAMIAYANRFIHGRRARNGCWRDPGEQPDHWIEEDMLTWRFAVPPQGMQLGDVGLTLRNPSGSAGTLFAAVYADELHDPFDPDEPIASTLIDVPAQPSPGQEIEVRCSMSGSLVPGRSHVLVFGTGHLGATLPSFEIPTFVFGDCVDAHDISEDFPQSGDSNPLEEYPEFFLETIDN